MMKTIIKIIGNGLFYGVATLFLCFCIGYFRGNLPLKTIFTISTPIAFSAMIINGAIYTRFTKPVKVLEKIIIKTEESESVIIEVPANHLIDGDIVSGKLCLTNNRLLFKSHDLQEFTWIKSDLHSMTFYPSFKNKGGEFTLKDKTDRKLMFEVDVIKIWKNELKIKK